MFRKDCDQSMVQHCTRVTRRRITAGVVLILCATPASGESVVLWPQATVTAVDVTLGDIARLDGFSAAQALVMSGVVIGVAPAPGKSHDLTLADVRSALRSSGANLAHLSLKGALSCSVHRPLNAATIPVQQQASTPEQERTLRDHIHSALQATVGTYGHALELVFRDRDQALLELAEPQYTFEIEPLPAGRLGLLSVSVSIRRGDAEPQRHHIRVTARLRLDVVVAVRPINRQQSVQREDVVIESRVFERLDRVGLQRSTDVIGQETRRGINTGDVLRVTDLKPSALVEKGDLVGVVARSPGIRVECSGKALENGSLGDVIEIRNEASGQTYRGKIVGLRRVEVVLTEVSTLLADGGRS